MGSAIGAMGRLAVEIVSPSTETTDRWEKLAAYKKKIPSLGAYLIAAQDRPRGSSGAGAARMALGVGRTSRTGGRGSRPLSRNKGHARPGLRRLSGFSSLARPRPSGLANETPSTRMREDPKAAFEGILARACPSSGGRPSPPGRLSSG